MSMQRYFAKEKTGEDITLYESDLHHIKNVMRGNVGDNIEVVDNGIVYLCQIENISPLKLKIVSLIDEDNEMQTKLSVAISLVNEQKMDLILQKLTELGVSTIIPVKTERSIIKLDDKKSTKKISRWQMICKEASEQSKRNAVPQVTEIMSLQELARIPNSLKLICSLAQNTKSLGKYIDKDTKEVLFVIGPEGGFTSKEEKYLMDNNFLPVSLGNRVMRVETAAIYVASVINYICEG